jgi:hypothetical protein
MMPTLVRTFTELGGTLGTILILNTEKNKHDDNNNYNHISMRIKILRNNDEQKCSQCNEQ